MSKVQAEELANELMLKSALAGLCPSPKAQTKLKASVAGATTAEQGVKTDTTKVRTYGDPLPENPHQGGKYAGVPDKTLTQRNRGVPQQARAPPLIVYPLRQWAELRGLSLSTARRILRSGAVPFVRLTLRIRNHHLHHPHHHHLHRNQ
jgi:hypothetical protein